MEWTGSGMERWLVVYDLGLSKQVWLPNASTNLIKHGKGMDTVRRLPSGESRTVMFLNLASVCGSAPSSGLVSNPFGEYISSHLLPT